MSSTTDGPGAVRSFINSRRLCRAGGVAVLQVLVVPLLPVQISTGGFPVSSAVFLCLPVCPSDLESGDLPRNLISPTDLKSVDLHFFSTFYLLGQDGDFQTLHTPDRILTVLPF